MGTVGGWVVPALWASAPEAGPGVAAALPTAKSAIANATPTPLPTPAPAMASALPAPTPAPHAGLTATQTAVAATSVDPSAAMPEAVAPAHVVIISIDGLRPDAMTPELMPRHVQLMREGLTARHASTITQSDTLPSHASMLSGVGAAAHGLWWNSYKANRGHIRVPTVFSMARQQGRSTAMIVGKKKLKHIATPESVDHFERPSYLCGGVSKRASQYFTEVKPDLLFIHFSDPDEYGHSHGWMSKEYVRAARNSDRCLAKVLEAIDGSPQGAQTLVIVTADHGGHLRRHSGGHSKHNLSIPWIARGPGVPRGATIDTPVLTVDTAATALAALDLPPLPNMRGQARIRFARKAR